MNKKLTFFKIIRQVDSFLTGVMSFLLFETNYLYVRRMNMDYNDRYIAATLLYSILECMYTLLM